VLVGDNAAILSSVAYRLDRSIVFPEDPAGEPFVVWKRARQPRSGPDWYVAEQRSALRLATRLAHDGSSPVLLPVESPLPSGSDARLRAHFGNGIEIDERYWIYAPTGERRTDHRSMYAKRPRLFAGPRRVRMSGAGFRSRSY
jgi:hypothetical protein